MPLGFKYEPFTMLRVILEQTTSHARHPFPLLVVTRALAAVYLPVNFKRQLGHREVTQIVTTGTLVLKYLVKRNCWFFIPLFERLTVKFCLSRLTLLC